MKHLLPLCLSLAVLSAPAIRAAEPPGIVHQPPRMAARGQPLSVMARVSSPHSPVTSVSLHFSQTQDASPTTLPMQQTSPGNYLATIPATYLSAKGTIRYYMEASNQAGEWAETSWYSVGVQDPTGALPAPGTSGSGSESNDWVWPTVIIGGGALVVAGAVALADSGGGGGGGGDNGGGDITDRIVVRSASGTSDTPFALLPSDTAVDGGTAIAGRTLKNIRVDLTYDPVDGAAEEFQVLYRGVPVLSSGQTVTAGSSSVTLSGSDTLVTFRVVSSEAGFGGRNTWTWNGSVTYILEEAPASP